MTPAEKIIDGLRRFADELERELSSESSTRGDDQTSQVSPVATSGQDVSIKPHGGERMPPEEEGDPELIEDYCLRAGRVHPWATTAGHEIKALKRRVAELEKYTKGVAPGLASP